MSYNRRRQGSVCSVSFSRTQFMLSLSVEAGVASVLISAHLNLPVFSTYSKQTAAAAAHFAASFKKTESLLSMNHTRFF